jgi:hypothetical protein
MLGFVQRHLVGRHREHAAVGIQVTADAHGRKVGRRRAGGHGDADGMAFCIADRSGCMRGLEDLGLAQRDVGRRDHHRMQGIAQGGAAELLDQHVAQRLAVVFGTEDLAREIAQLADRTRRQPAAREDRRAVLHEQVAQQRHRHFEGQRDGEQAADRGAGDEVEAPAQRFAGHLFQLGQDTGGVQAQVAAAGQREDAERAIGGRGHGRKVCHGLGNANPGTVLALGAG